MTQLAHRLRYTFAEYIRLERDSPIKHEYWDGNIYAMAGGTPDHASLAASIATVLGRQLLPGPCRHFSSDLRIRVPATGLTTYPDLSVVCGRRDTDPEDKNSVTNPTLLVEVLSDSTESYDRGDKFEHYKRLATLRQYVLVSQGERRVDVWTRGGDGEWRESTYRDGDVAELPSIEARVDVRELYDLASEPAA